MPERNARQSRPKVSPARTAAFTVLRELASSANTHSDDLLQAPRIEQLAVPDRHLCTALVMGVLRWQLALDTVIAPLLTRKSKLDEPVRIALRMGAFQLLQMDRVPPHAAISDSVELTKRSGYTSAGGLVNAVLRKLSLGTFSLDTKEAHPQWMRERWQRSFGDAPMEAVCAYDQEQPPMTLRLSSAMESQATLQPGAFLAAARRFDPSGASARPVPTEDIRWQDEGSQLVAELLGGGPAAPASILDCCAAPGGKTAILAERFPAARAVAWDISTARLTRMREAFRSSKTLSHIVCEVADCVTAPVHERFDLILCDVPCSGTGTLARNPEIKLRLQPDDLLRQQQRQIAILKAAVARLVPGGRLLYSTCSLEPEENEAVIASVLQQAHSIHMVPIAERLQEMHVAGALHEDGLRHLQTYAIQGDALRTIPGVSLCDGFFAALLTVDAPTERP